MRSSRLVTQLPIDAGASRFRRHCRDSSIAIRTIRVRKLESDRKEERFIQTIKLNFLGHIFGIERIWNRQLMRLRTQSICLSMRALKHY
jgi:hypothetical protein